MKDRLGEKKRFPRACTPHEHGVADGTGQDLGCFPLSGIQMKTRRWTDNETGHYAIRPDAWMNAAATCGTIALP